MKLKANIATSDNGFIFNPATGDSYTSNTIAAFILALMKAGKADADIKLELLDTYDVEATALERDWEDWLLQLKDANLLEAK
ncbi:PqqD family protein [Mucilaginibacter sp.]|uniref:PqqD family protein n=1 Tax=Mucilaginibacter sp. TaxID=1882438 RepID=UPI0032636745